MVLLYLCNIPPQQKNDSGRTKAKGNGGKTNTKANGKTTTKKKKSSAKKVKGKGKKQSGDDKDDDGKKKKSVKELNKEKAVERKNTKKMKYDMLSKYPKQFTTNVPVVKDGMLAHSKSLNLKKGMASTLAITLHTWSVGNNAATTTQLGSKRSVEKARRSERA
eukprot:scaffold11552_cov76-Skeletonema_dohrnii-CCMP3373.AAC.5